MPSKVYSGYKPINTLHTQHFTHQDQPFRGSAGSSRTKAPSVQLPKARLASGVGAISNAPSGDEYTTAERQTKRRKMELEDDGIEALEIGGGDIFELNGKRLPSTRAVKSAGRISVRSPVSELKNAYDHSDLGLSKTKNRRRSGGHYLVESNSSQGSRHDLSSLQMVRLNGHDANELGTQSNAVVIDEMKSPPAARENTRVLDRSKVPPIALGKGVDRPGTPRKTAEISQSSVLQHKASPSRRPSVERMVQRQSRDIARNGQDRSKHLQEPFKQPLHVIRSQGSLAKKFVRDEGSAVGKPESTSSRRDQSERVRIEDRVSPISSDELAGENTFLKRGVSQDFSPAKQSRHVEQLRRSSPSDISQTTFKQKVKKATLTEPRVSERDEQTKAQILSFFSKACVLTCEDNLWLHWDELERTIDVYRNGQPLVYERQLRVVSLEASNIKKIWYSKEIDKVHMTGSADGFSNGHTCIEFAHVRDVHWFLDVAGVINQSCSLQYETPERMESVFKHQSNELRKCSLRKDHNRDLLELAATVLQRPREIVQSDDEQIEYEDESGAPVQVNDRHRMSTEEGPASSKSSKLRSVVRASNDDQRNMSPYFADTTRRSTRFTQPLRKLSRSRSPPERWTQIHKAKPWAQPVLYPPQGGPGSATVDFGDLATLDEGQFLNDNIIAFALRQLQDKMMPEHREQVHFFNSFFYSTLTSKNGKQSACNFEAVKRWTKKADLLSKPFIVVPINSDLHWYLAIICNIDQLPRKVAGFEDESSALEAAGSSPAHKEAVVGSSPPNTASQLQAPADLDKDSIRVLASGKPQGTDQAIASQASNGRKLKKKSAPPLRKYANSQPIIITLDSLGSTHPAELRNLKDYIVAEALDKRDISIQRDLILGMNVKEIPGQSNFCDCGLYLVRYAEEFVKDPRKFVDRILSREQMDLESDFAKFDPSKKREDIRDELLRLTVEQDAAREAKKKQKAQGKKAEKPAVTPASKAETLTNIIREPAGKVDNETPKQAGTKPKENLDQDPMRAVPATHMVERPNNMDREAFLPLDQGSTAADGGESFDELEGRGADELEMEVPLPLKRHSSFTRFSSESPVPEHNTRPLGSQIGGMAGVNDTDHDSTSRESSIADPPRRPADPFSGIRQ